jgi:hypothetical protein
MGNIRKSHSPSLKLEAACAADGGDKTLSEQAS